MYHDMFTRYQDSRFLFESIESLDILTESIDNIIGELDVNKSTILEASLKEIGKSIWIRIIGLFKKIRTAFKNFLLNVNYLKNAKLPKLQVDDLEKILKVLQPRTLTGSNIIPKFYNLCMTFKKDPSKVEVKDAYIKRNSGSGLYKMNTELEHEIDKTVRDVGESIEAMNKLPEYQRFAKNEYDQKDIQDIPMNNIISDMKDCNKSSTDLEVELEKIVNRQYLIPEDNTDLKRLSNKIVIYCNKLINYYSTRIKLLNTFFKSAKASLKAVANNVKNGKNFNTKTETKSNRLQFKVKIGADRIAKVKELQNKMKEANDNKNWNEYKKIHEETCQVLKIKPKSTFSLCVNDKENIGICAVYKNDYDKIPVGRRPLYHQGSNEDMTELLPTAVGNFGNTYYPEPRVYVHLAIALNKAAKQIGKNTSKTIKP